MVYLQSGATPIPNPMVIIAKIIPAVCQEQTSVKSAFKHFH